MQGTRTRRARALRRACASVAALGALAAGPADAAVVTTVTEEGVDYVVYVADQGHEDVLLLGRPTTSQGFVQTHIQIYNRLGGIRVGGDCTTVGDPNNTTTVECPNPDAIAIDLGDNVDELETGSEVGQIPVIADGGAGPDRLLGGPADDGLTGGEGNDVILRSGGANELGGNGGDDLLVSGPGDERLDGGPGDDTIEQGSGGGGSDDARGGEGTDLALFDEHGPVSISLDDAPGDGAAGANGNYHSDIENVEVDAGGSTVVGSDGPNVLRAHGSGAQTVLDGRGGNDVLRADFGAQRLVGGEGDDELTGGTGDDVLEGGAGRDNYVADTLDAIGSGADVIRSADGISEPIQCGPGPDVAEVDESDVIAADGINTCEQLTRVGGGGGGGNGDTSAPALGLPALRAPRLGTALRRGLAVGATCSEACTATATATIPASLARRLRLPRTVGRASAANIAAGARGRLVVRFTRAARRKLARQRRVTLTVVVVATDAAGNRASARRSVRLRR